ncbi:MAG: DUF4347 domain-containing protein [Spirulina sp. SIO3F2]|nr:DUF4347 domain-containing protein [Spirulina sp. SIO3F2]
MIAPFSTIQAGRVLLAALPLSLFTAQPLLAQSITAAPDGTGTIIQHQGNTYNIEGGTQAGANLFHSFQEFGLSSGEIASFLSNPSITNIFGRVTGGNASVINGLIQANPNLYLMNPAGIVFGVNAQLNVGGDFFATTADRIGFDGGWFNTTGANDYTTLLGTPNQFAFLSATPGAILNFGHLNTSQNLSLVGGTVLNKGKIHSTAGTVTLAAIPGEQLVNISQPGMLLSLAVAADALTPGISPLNLPELLTGQAQTVASPVTVGDVLIIGEVTGQQVDLYAAGQVIPTDPNLVQGDTTVVRFPSADGTTTLSIIDAHADNAQDLLFGGAPGTIATIVQDTENGIAAVTETLSRIDAPLDGMSITAEGNEGNFWLGNTWITPESIQNVQDQLAQWSGAFTENADLLLYSCFTALGTMGEALMASLAAATGLDVAASTNATGSANHGGDWVLESSTGSIETQTPFTDKTLANWDGKLATFTVQNGADSGTDSLRDAINNANSAAGADEIRFANGVTLVDLTSGELSITEELTITGGSNNVTIQRNAGAADFRIFNVTGSATTTFDNLTITNGQTADNGAGINSNGAINLSNSTVSGNTSSDRGGGLYTTGAVTLTNSTVANNSSTDDGGGLYTRNAGITLTDSTVSGNSSNRYGGGVYTKGQITLTNSTVANNSSRRNGAGLYSRSGNITLTNSTVSSNSSNRHGGGVWARSHTITLTNSTVTGNSSRLSAAGIYSTNIHITDSVVSNNTSGDQGGGMYATGTITLTNSTLSGNSSASKGGGMYSRNNLTITNSTLSGNSSNRGGGIYSRGGGTVNLINTTISGNSSSHRGGGLFARGNGGGTMTLLNSTVADNTSGNNGGGLFRNGGTVNLTNTIVANNTASGSGNDLSGTFNTIQNSLIGDTAGATISTSTNTLTDLDPGLFALGDYGGDTQTYALRPDSVAINAGSNALTTVTTDQRGASRVFEGTVDIGAYESHGFALAAIASGLDATQGTTVFDVSVQVVEGAFAQAIPLDGLTVNYALDNGAVFGSFSNGTTVITNAQGIAVNFFNLTGFEEHLNSTVQILATPINLPSFIQSVASTNITINFVEGNELDIGFDCHLIQLGASLDYSTACAAPIDAGQFSETVEEDTSLIINETGDRIGEL